MNPRTLSPWLIVAVLACIIPAAWAGPDESDNPGYLGVMLQRVEGGLAEALDMEEDGGVLLGQIVDESPAAKAGLESGDIVVKIDGDDVGTPDDLRKAVRGRESGTTVEVEFLRDGKRGKLDVTLGDAPAERRIEKRIMKKTPRRIVKELRLGKEHGFLGVVSQSLTEDLGDYFGVEGGAGALVAKVVEDSPAETLGLKAGDVIVRVGEESIESPDDLRLAIHGYDKATEVEVAWVRDRKEKTGKVELEIQEGPTPRVFSWHSDGDGDLEELILKHHDGDIDLDDSCHEGIDLRCLEGLDHHFGKLKHQVRDGCRQIRRIEIREEAGEAIEKMREELEELKKELQKMKEKLED